MVRWPTFAIGIALLALGVLAVVFGDLDLADAAANAAPSITLPGAILVARATSPRGAAISYLAAATDDVAPARIDCSPQSGTLFPVGTTNVECVAADAAGATTTRSFAVHVKGAPEQIADLVAVVQALVPSAGPYAGLLEKLRTALADAQLDPKSACGATGAFLNELRAQTGKKIDEGRAQQLLDAATYIQAALGCIQSRAPPAFFAPGGDIIIDTAPHLPTARVLYNATSAGADVSVACDRPGPDYAIGRTLVTCSAAAGGRVSAPSSFRIVVLDNELPQVTVPADITTHAAVGRSGAEVTFTASATDNSGPITPTCLPASGSTFAVGVTTVTCTATDPSGNTASASFHVTVDLVITGRVTDLAGMPARGAVVRVFLASAPFQDPQFRVARVTADANGIYFAVVSPGTYKVLHGGLESPYFEKWWRDRGSLADADVVTVSATSVGAVDAQLERGFFIRGRATDAATGRPIQGVGVNLNQANTFCCIFAGGSGTGENGDFAILARPGQYKVLFYSNVNTAGAYAPEWWAGQTSFAAATTITITSADRPNVDAALRPGIVVTGRVTDRDTGAPIQNAGVNANDSTLPCCSLVSFAFTNQNGDYKLVVRPGTFKLTLFAPPGSLYLTEWWNGKTTFDSADPLILTADRLGVDGQLSSGVLVHGSVTADDTGTGIAGVDVNVIDCCPRNFINGTRTHSDGSYAVLAPKGRPVKIQFRIAGPSAPPYVQEWYDNQPDFNRALTLTFTAETFHIDAGLARALFIRGQVTDRSTGLPLQGIDVAASDGTVPCCVNVGNAQTDAGGNYALPVRSGTYRVWFGDGDAYLPLFWNDQTGPEQATPVVVTGDVGGINARLMPTVAVHGRVTDELTHAGIGNIHVFAHDAAAGCCPFRTLSGALTAPDGTYTLMAPKGVAVKLQFYVGPDSPPYFGEWYDNQRGPDLALVRTFTSETLHIDAELAPAVMVHGTVTDELSGLGIADIGVNAFDGTANCCVFISGTRTGPGGAYDLLVPKGHPVKLSFFPFDSAGAYLPEWYDNQPQFDSAPARTFTAETFHIDAALTPVVFIHGTVVDEISQTGVGRIFVDVFDASRPCCWFLGGGRTEDNGTYRFPAPKGKSVKIQFEIHGSNPPPYVGEWFDNQPDFASARVLTLTGDQQVDAALARAFIVSGKVTDRATTLALSGVQVVASDATRPCCIDVVATRTDANGEYRLPVGGGTYRIWFGNAAGYLPLFWNDQTGPDQANPVAVSGNVGGIDAALIATVAVHGTVRDAISHAGVGNIHVFAHDAAVGCCPFRTLSGAVTNADGSYTLMAPKGVAVKLQFWIGPDSPLYIGEWYDDQPGFERANVRTFTAETSNIDAALAPAVVIHGTVTDEVTHTGIGGIGVNANDANEPCCVFINGIQTTGDGSYSLTVPIGRPIRIFFSTFGPNPPPYLSEWYDGKPYFEVADTKTFTAEAFHIDAALTRAVHLRGTVTDEATGRGIGPISIQAVDPTVPCCPFRPLGGGQTNPDGSYDVLVAKGVPLKIQFFVWRPDDPAYVQEWYDNQPDVGPATALTFDTDSELSVALAPAVSVRGTVTDKDTHELIGRISVQAVDATLPCCHPIAFAETRDDGTYRLIVRKNASVKIFFLVYRPNDPPYLAEWDHHQPTFETAALHVLSADAVVDAELTHALVISGTVTDRVTGLPLAMIQVGVSDATISPCCIGVGSGMTDSAGKYAVRVPAGTYRVWFGDDATPRYMPEFYNRKGPGDATPVVVAGDVTVNAQLVPAVLMHGVVTDAVSHAAVRDIGIAILDTTVPCCVFLANTGAMTDASGNYALLVPKNVAVKILFADNGAPPHHAAEWYDDQPDPAHATPLLLAAETFGINAALMPLP